MGNTSAKRSDTLSLREHAGSLDGISEEVQCSICMDFLEDPVSIECGHNFCRACITAAWATGSAREHTCPECRRPCDRDKLVSDVKINNVVQKVQQVLQERQKRAMMAQADCSALEEPLKLIGLDDDGNLVFHEDVLSRCFLREDIKDKPLCLISVIGEQRKGKSFLLNYLLRRLNRKDCENDSWLGGEEELLQGFEWRAGVNSTTKGIWIWSKHFVIEGENGPVAVFLVDTEGSLDYERSKDTSVKLSALSMLLSSYLIYNVGMMVKETDLEYLEMFVHVAEGVGKSFSLQPIERLDLLVRDWFCPPVYGVKGGQDYLQNTIKKVEGCSKYQKSLQTLRTRSRCYLMPFPGKKVAMGEGAVKDMDEDFKDCLKSYINSLLGSVQQCVKKDMENHQLTCEQLAGKIKKFTEIMKRAEYGFSSPLEMKMVLNNHMTLERAKEEYQKFREEQETNTNTFIKTLKKTPKKMKVLMEEKINELAELCASSLQGDPRSNEVLLTELKQQMNSDAHGFSERYIRQYKISALKAGVAIGATGIGLAGGVVGAAVAAAVVAAEAGIAAIGAAVGSGAFAFLGGGVGAGIGFSVGAKKASDSEADQQDCDEEFELLVPDSEDEIMVMPSAEEASAAEDSVRVKKEK
ncbi:RING finger protein 112-like [Latimeria chalumnae]|uniref:RING finger protein 112-like n=1 Tax=Latimeria chalumnae TaxID=7897 RepID=UPI00313CB398